MSQRTPQWRRDEFVKVARAAGLRVDPVEPHGVNVWAVPTTRYPETTVWFDSAGYMKWGANYEHYQPAPIFPSVAVAMVAATLSTNPAPAPAPADRTDGWMSGSMK